MTTAMKVAKYLQRQNIVYGEMQLQKLLYYSQAWSLAWTGKPLFGDEIEAWAKGPVIRNVWAARKYEDFIVTDDGVELSDDEREIVDAVYQHYGSNGGAALSLMTHAELPWVEARDGLPAGAASTSPVSQATMRRFYTKVSVSDNEGPKRPVRVDHPDTAQVEFAGRRQSSRWREALDALAHR